MSIYSSRVSDPGNVLNRIIDINNSNVKINVKEKVKEKLAGMPI